MEIIKSLCSIDHDTLFAAFSEAFKDYARSWSRQEFEDMLKRRGFEPSLSFGAFDGERLVSFIFNGTGLFNGKQTAYDTGTGTVDGYRAKGLATALFKASLPHLSAAGISQYLLEVLQNNDKALSVYRQAGLSISRELNYFIAPANAVKLRSKELPDAITIKPTTIQHEHMRTLWDFEPAWQNSFDAVFRAPDNFKIMGAYQNDELIGYCIFEPAAGDITQLAVKKESRRQGIATCLLNAVLPLNTHTAVKAINTDVSCTTITAFFDACKISLKGRQYEMLMPLA